MRAIKARMLALLTCSGCLMAQPRTDAEFEKRAGRLVNAFGKKEYRVDRALDAERNVSFGECGFRYDPEKRALIARIYLGEAFSSDDDEKSKTNVRKVVHALNDPEQLQNTFELAGGRIELDEETRNLYLVKELPVEGMTLHNLRKEMNDLLDLGAKWELRWLSWAGAIVHGNAPPPGPPLPVTRQNNDQHKEFRR